MIKCKQLTKRFGEFAALNSVDLSVQTGSIFGLVGSNGAGKSTLLRTLAGVYRPDGGEATVNSQQVFENREIKSKLRFVPDELRLPRGARCSLWAGSSRGCTQPGTRLGLRNSVCGSR